MDKKIYYDTLYEYYKTLLTDKQREYYESYNYQDLSLSEIAENENVSRNAVHNQIKIVQEKLLFYEENLHLLENANKIRKILKNTPLDIQEKIEELI